MKSHILFCLIFVLLASLTQTGCKTKKGGIEKKIERHKSQFISGFEGDVQVSKNIVDKGTVWQQTIRGIDSETGAHWPSDLPGDASKSIFIYLINENHNPANWVKSEIRNTIAHDKSTTRALYQEVKKPGKSHNKSWIRNQFGLVNNPPTTFNHIKVKYRLKIQENLEEVMPGKSWRQLMEIRGVDSEFRIHMTLNRLDSNSPISWKIEAQKGDSWKKEKPIWIKSNFNKNYDLAHPTIPIGKWFELEFELISKSDESGKFICRINDEVLVEHTGVTATEKGLHTWHMFKVYASENALRKGKHYQWIDDVEITVY